MNNPYLGNMAAPNRDTYQSEDGLERAVIDLVRVGTTGFGSGVRQLATRLVRAVPPTVADPKAFRDELHAALAKGSQSPSLRFAAGEVPTDGDATHPLVDVEPFPSGGGLVLAADTQTFLTDIVSERQRASELAAAGIELTKTLLLSGPPGVGKSLTARWLAEQIGVPLVTMDLATVVSSFLGNSGRNVRSVLDYAKSGPCVLLLDEFDAIAKRRDDDTDIGELKRIVNVILVELDRWPDTSLLVAATNHDQLLDDAVDRRFDRHLVLQLPGLAERQLLLARLASDCGLNDASLVSLVASLTEGASGSDLVRLWMNARRTAVLRETSIRDEVVRELARHPVPASPSRDTLWRMLADELGMSSRQIAAFAQVSHPTVNSGIKRARGK